MLTVDHDEFMVEELAADPEFFRVYCEEAMKTTDPFVFREALQYIIRVKNFNLDIVEREKESA